MPIKTETLKHHEAFEYYYSLGHDRTLKAVAEEYKVTEKTTVSWSKDFGWKERVEQRDIEIARGLEQKTNTTVINEKANYRRIIKASIADFVARLRDGNVRVESISDFERLVKLDMLLMGEPDQRMEVEYVAEWGDTNGKS